MLTYLGRQRFQLNDGGKYPECGFVGYNLRHSEIQNFVNRWEQLYVTDDVFKLLEISFIILSILNYTNLYS